MKPLDQLTNMEELQRLLARRQSGKSRTIDESVMFAALSERIKGQDHVLRDVIKIIKLQWAKEQRKRPIANLLFVGPPGTGKTELAKVMANFLFGDDNAMVRFDCQDLMSPESKSTLIGNPLGYVGATKGGRLTRPLLSNPKRLILFDEIEKGHSSIFDVFLTVMGEGRLVEQGSGDVADFTQSVIVLTSNSEFKTIGELQTAISDPYELDNAIKSHLVSTGQYRPELMSRVDKILVFNPLSEGLICEIIGVKLQSIANEYGLILDAVDAKLIEQSLDRGMMMKGQGARALDREINDTYGEGFILAKEVFSRHPDLEKRIRLSKMQDGSIDIEPVGVPLDDDQESA